MYPKINHRSTVMLLLNGEHIEHLASTKGCADGGMGATIFMNVGHAAGRLM